MHYLSNVTGFEACLLNNFLKTIPPSCLTQPTPLTDFHKYAALMDHSSNRDLRVVQNSTSELITQVEMRLLFPIISNFVVKIDFSITDVTNMK